MTVVSDYRALLSNAAWTGTPDTAIVLTYSFSTAATAYVSTVSPSAAATFRPAGDAEKAVIRAALAAWASVSGITFEEVSATPGDITFGFYNLGTLTGVGGEAGLGNYPSPGTYTDANGAPQIYNNFLPQGGDIYFDSSYQTNPAYSSDFMHVALHEIGHALGLKHPFDPAMSGPSYTLTPALDTGSQTVMAYAGARLGTLGPLDIAAIQALYGTPTGALHPFTQSWNAATESLTTTGSSTIAQSLFGSGGNDTFYSLGPRDALSGGEGDDIFYLAGRPASVNGGGGLDTVVTGLAYSPVTAAVQGSGTALRYIYRPASSDFMLFVNVAVVDFTNGLYNTATNAFTAFPNTFAWRDGSGWVLAGAAAGLGANLPVTLSTDQVALTGAATPTAPARIANSGTAGSLNLNAGYATLAGAYAVGALNIGSLGAAGLTLGSGAQLVAAGEAVIRQVDTSAPALSVGAGSAVQLAGLALTGPSARQVALGTGSAALLVAPGGTLEIGASQPTATPAPDGAVLIDPGALLSGSGAIGAPVVNNGTLRATGGQLALGALGGSGVLQIAADGTAIVAGSLAGQITFLGTGGTLDIVAPQGGTQAGVTQAATISNFTQGDTIELLGATAPTDVTYSIATGLLTLSNAGGIVTRLHIDGAYAASLFQIGTRPGGVTAITVTAPDPLFDAAYYLAQNPDVAAAGVSPYQHYLTFGWHEGRNPNAVFDTLGYLAQNPDVAAAGINPLLHFETNGWAEGREPSLLFDDQKYLAAYPDVAAAGMNPVQHYVMFGHAESRMTFLTGGTAPADVLVDAAYYDAQLGATLIPTGLAAAQQAAWSYDQVGWQRGLNPDPLFDTTYYLAHNPDVAAAHVDPLWHYETSGWREGRDPSAAFSTSRYLAAYADVKAAGMDPLQHYLTFGQYEGRTTFAA